MSLHTVTIAINIVMKSSPEVIQSPVRTAVTEKSVFTDGS
jgi:hypothetical protein